MKIVPELLCRDIEATKAFYLETFGFQLKYERRNEKFAYFTLDGVDLMCEEVSGPGRRWITGELQLPYGRGVNFQWDVRDVDGLYERVRTARPDSIFLDIESRVYETDDGLVSQRQFVAQDPDGYLFRFCSGTETDK